MNNSFNTISINNETIEKLLAFRLGDMREEDIVCPELAKLSATLSGVAKPEDIQIVDEHMKQCHECTQTISEWRALTKSNQPIFSQLSSFTLFVRQHIKFLSFTFVGAMAIFFALSIWHQDLLEHIYPKDTQNFGQIAMKGGDDTITIAVQRGTERFSLTKNHNLQDGDQISFFYTTTKDGYLALLSVEQTGNTSLLFPIDSQLSAQIRKGANIALPHGAIIEKQTNCEWIVGVFSDQPLKLSSILVTARQAALQSNNDCQLPIRIIGARTVITWK
ncbi:MAG: DUF4384 domain-containing protein [Deltaproteobacteria bacterium]|nr:DUF4384 domain-containing protein [Deltaproteobacteria bacterium]